MCAPCISTSAGTFKNAQEIEISRADDCDHNQKPAIIKFSSDYSSFTGMDFGGGRIVAGFQIIPKGTAPAGASQSQ